MGRGWHASWVREVQAGNRPIVFDGPLENEICPWYNQVSQSEEVSMPSIATLLIAGSLLATTDTTTIRVITYNVQFLPEPVAFLNERPNAEYRAQRIAEEVSRYDLVGLQEAFHSKHRGQILDHLRKAWDGQLNHVLSPKPDGFLTSGGCALLTMLPVRTTTSSVFANFSKPADYGIRADGFAAKGVIHARISRSEDDLKNTLDVFVTHLEARDDDIRPRQYVELADFIRQASDPARPMLLMGDMNTKGMIENREDADSQYSLLMRQLHHSRPDGGVIDIWPRLRGKALGGTTTQASSETGKRIDYIFVGNPKTPAPQLRPTSIEVKPYLDAEVTALSDHSAVVVEFEWTSSSHH